MSDHPVWNGRAIAELAAIQREQAEQSERLFTARKALVEVIGVQIGAALESAGFPYPVMHWHEWRMDKRERQCIHELANLILDSAVRACEESQE